MNYNQIINYNSLNSYGGSVAIVRMVHLLFNNEREYRLVMGRRDINFLRRNDVSKDLYPKGMSGNNAHNSYRPSLFDID